MRTILIIAAKNLLLTWRDRFGFFWWLIAFPLLIAVMIGSIFAGALQEPAEGVPFAVVDLAPSQDTREFLDVLGNTGAMDITQMSPDAARDAVRRGDMAAFVELRAGFRVSPALLFGETLPVALGVDPIRRAEAAYYEAALYDAAMTLLQRHWFDPARRPQMVEAWIRERRGTVSAFERASIDVALAAVDRLTGAAPPTSTAASTGPAADTPGSAAAPSGKLSRVEFVPVMGSTRPQSAFEICFPIGAIWGLLGLAASFATRIVRDRESGTLIRLRAAPINRNHILAGNGLAAFVACIGVTLLLLGVGIALFGVRVQSVPVLVVAVLCTAVCFVGVTMFLSVLGDTETAVSGAGWAFLLVMALLGGGMVPQIFLPAWMDLAGNLSFVKWAVRGLEGGIWRGLTLSEIGLPAAILLVEGALFGAAGLILGSRQNRW